MRLTGHIRHRCRSMKVETGVLGGRDYQQNAISCHMPQRQCTPLNKVWGPWP